MYRTAINDLKDWKARQNHKPLVVEGARQVGKTWLIKKFGAENYENLAYVNLEKDEKAKEIFDGDFDPNRIIARLSLHLNMEINPENTLIVIDEAQENPRVLTALKYFCEDKREQDIIVAGSLLGIALHKDSSFPVGKVNFLKMGPLSFEEFLIAAGKEKLAKELKAQNYEMLTPFHDTLMELQKTYSIVGGMPEVVQTFLDDGQNLLNVRAVQEEIIKDYERDFSKHADKFDAPKIQEIFNIIPAVLAKENKKFMFGMIKQSARAREYETALAWLINSGVATRASRVKKLGLPLSAYVDLGAFKLFYVDIGLLGCKAGVRPETIYDEKMFAEFKGAFAEQFVLQELIAARQKAFYYSTDDSQTEVDFVIDSAASGVLPIEVKSGRALESASLKKVLTMDETLRAVKLSVLPYQENERITNLPLYAAMNLG